MEPINVDELNYFRLSCPSDHSSHKCPSFFYCDHVECVNNHMFDTYSVCHFLNATLAACALITIGVSPYWILLPSVLWEFYENSPHTVNKYRKQPGFGNYRGDTFLGSTGDNVIALLACIFARASIWYVLAVYVIGVFVGTKYMVDNQINLAVRTFQLFFEFKFPKLLYPFRVYNSDDDEPSEAPVQHKPVQKVRVPSKRID